MRQFLLISVLVFGFVGVAEAGKFHAIHNGRHVIAHTRPGPVIAHRILPPYGLRRHIYVRPAYVQPVPVVQPVYAPVVQPVYAPVVQPVYAPPVLIRTDNFYLRIGR